jgi:hypothetical protein
MSVQLLIGSQVFNSISSSPPGPEMMVDSYAFATVNTSPSAVNLTGVLPQSYISANTFNVNSWYRFSANANSYSASAGAISGTTGTGILQRLSNLTVGVQYNLVIGVTLNTAVNTFYHFSGNTLVSSQVISTSGTSSLNTFTPLTSTDTIVIFNTTGATIFRSISVKTSSTNTRTVNNGFKLCDLYEDEDLPLTLSVDDFKNVAEQVQSYSKAFNVPATKNNNKIFDNIFEITRSDNGSVFNPYVKTKCQLKQDGFILFEGFLQLLDIQDKEGEVSYNINLYSQVIALADDLQDRNFGQISFLELDHLYNKTNIKNSWNNSPNAGITYTNAATSGFRDANDTLKYPFVSWNNSYTLNSSTGFPILPNLESSFRPFIQIKYLIDRIFTQPSFDYSYTSEFFNTTDFKKLYMDFNWGGNEIPIPENSYYATWNFGSGAASNIGNGSFKELRLIPDGVTGGDSNSTVPPNYNTSTYIITATTDNEIYKINYTFRIHNTDASGQNTASLQWVHNSSPIDVISGVIIGASTSFYYQGSFTIALNNGDTLKAQFQGGLDIYQDQGAASSVTFNVSTTTVSSATLNTLRGELGQWEFLKGIMTMFNLVSMPDKSNPNNIFIEPYNDIFLNNPATKQLNWTDKIDVSEIKLNPLTDLNKTTIFKFVEDDDDFAFMNYKGATEGHLYGSKIIDASTSANGLETILQGEKEIIAEPFAATVPKPLNTQFPDLITPAIYSYNPDDGTSEGFANSPRIMYNNGIKSLAANTFTSCTYFIPSQNGVSSENADAFLQFSHLSTIPTTSSSLDFHFGECQLIQPIGNATPNNLFNTYWLPYFNELYNPDARTMSIKVNLNSGDINTFNFFDRVMIKNREFRVNKIDYKPNDLAVVEFILIP